MKYILITFLVLIAAFTILKFGLRKPSSQNEYIGKNENKITNQIEEKDLIEKPESVRDIEKVITVQNNNSKRLLAYDYIVGVGIGKEEKQGNWTYTLNVYFKEEPTTEQKKEIGESIDGVPVKYIFTGVFRAY